jgi:hypothetical protein
MPFIRTSVAQKRKVLERARPKATALYHSMCTMCHCFCKDWRPVQAETSVCAAIAVVSLYWSLSSCPVMHSRFAGLHFTGIARLERAPLRPLMSAKQVTASKQWKVPIKEVQRLDHATKLEVSLFRQRRCHRDFGEPSLGTAPALLQDSRHQPCRSDCR